MTHTPTRTDTTPAPPADPSTPISAGRDRRVVVAIVATLLVAAVTVFALSRDGDVDGQTADLNHQGDPDAVLAADAARLVRRHDGLVVEVEVSTPEPGGYEYPTRDMIPEWAEPHPAVSPGASDAPEVFTLWLFAFNHPERCTDAVCDFDDLGPETAARGGSFQVDGRVADDDTLRLAGNVLLGQGAASGAPLENPVGAEVHVAIAPHGRRLPGPDGWRQLNGPVGNPSLWWAASFPP